MCLTPPEEIRRAARTVRLRQRGRGTGQRINDRGRRVTRLSACKAGTRPSPRKTSGTRSTYRGGTTTVTRT